MLAKQFVFRVAKKFRPKSLMKLILPSRAPAQDDAVGVFDEFAVLQLALQQRLLGAPALGDVFGQNELGGTPLIGDGVGDDFDVDDRSVLGDMLPDPGAVAALSSTETTSSRRSGVSSLTAYVAHRHAQEFSARISILAQAASLTVRKASESRS
jgi:hypothetical protein